ncbi:MAG: CGNR zinc finger domain-containing protein [Actinomycetota bacterium]|nr:CGNR zinc finger domain-containing protein [Actinomycetota bacterium]
MFTNYRDEAAALAADLVNTVGSITQTDFMPDLDAFRAFLDEHGLEAGDATEGDLEEVRALRRDLRSAFFARGDDELASILNSLLSRSGARPEVTNHDGTWHLHYVSADAPLARRLTVLTSMGLAALVSDLGSERLGICQAHECEDVYVDTSRNRSRRYCNDKCTTRMNVAAYRARHKGTVN